METLRAGLTPDNHRSNSMKILTTSGGLLPVLGIAGTTLAIGFGAGRLSAPVTASDRAPAAVTIQSQEVRTLRPASPSESTTGMDSPVDKKPGRPGKEDLIKILGNPVAKNRSTELDALLAGVDATGARQILDLVTSMPDGPGKRLALGKVMQKWGELDGAAAAAYGVEAFERTGNVTLLRNAMLGWAQSDPASSMQYLQGLDLGRGLANDFTRAVLGVWSDFDPAAAAAYLQVNPGSQGGWGGFGRRGGSFGRGSGDPALIVADNWAAQDPQAAANWAWSLPAGAQQGMVMNIVLQNWVDQDPNGAATFVNSQPAGSAKDGMVSGLVRSLAADDPASAMKWVASMGNQGMQVVTAMSVLGQAGVFGSNKGTDTALAQSLVSTLPQNVQQQIMQRLTNRGVAPGGGARGTGGR